MSPRTLPIHFKNRDLYGLEVYTQSNAKPAGFTPVFSETCRFFKRKTTTASDLYQKKCGPFSVVSSRYLNRGRVWIRWWLKRARREVIYETEEDLGSHGAYGDASGGSICRLDDSEFRTERESVFRDADILESGERHHIRDKKCDAYQHRSRNRADSCEHCC